MTNNKVLIVNYFIGLSYNSIGKIKRWCDCILKYLLIDCNRKIIVYTDNSKDLELLRKQYKDITFVLFNNNQLNRYYLLSIKFHLMFKAFLDYKHNCDYICFAQSNLNVFDFIYLKDLIFDKYKIQLIYHFCFNSKKDKFLKLYGNNIETTVDINGIINNIPNNLIYYQSGLSIYTPDIFLWLYNEINNRMLLDFYNQKFVKWHDETYLNYIINFVLDDKSIINVKKYNDKFNFLNKTSKKYIHL